jgi:hypothetical protein
MDAMKQALMLKIKELSDLVQSGEMEESPEMEMMEMSENKDKQESDLAPKPMMKQQLLKR